MRISASSTFALLSGVFGFMLAPVLVGAVADRTDLHTSWAIWWGFCCGLNCLVLGACAAWERVAPLPYEERPYEEMEELEEFQLDGPA